MQPPVNGKPTPGATAKVKISNEEEDRCRLRLPKNLRQFALYDSPTKIQLHERYANYSEARHEELIAAHKEKQARHTTELYGPSHPQSWENLYSPAIKMLREMGIVK